MAKCRKAVRTVRATRKPGPKTVKVKSHSRPKPSKCKTSVR